MKKKSIIVPLRLIELEEENYHLLIESQLSNNESAYWVIDTGASKSVFDSNKVQFYLPEELSNHEVKSAGIGEGHIETTVGIIEKIKFGELELKNWKVALINLEHINKLYQKFTSNRIIGLLGSDFLVRYKVLINFEKLQLEIQN